MIKKFEDYVHEQAQAQFSSQVKSIAQKANALANQRFTPEQIKATPKNGIIHDNYAGLMSLKKMSKAELNQIEKWQDEMLKIYNIDATPRVSSVDDLEGWT